MPDRANEYHVEHHIQKHIIGVLIHCKYARFRDLRPPKTDTNLFSYHLKALISAGFIEKHDAGYTLSGRGLGYVDRVSLKKMAIRSQPKIITMLFIRDNEGRVLLQKREKQPYIDTWTLPYGKTHISDPSLDYSALRETEEKLGVSAKRAVRIGDAYIRVRDKTHHLSTTLAHVFSVTLTEQPGESDILRWYKPGTENQNAGLSFAPAVTKLLHAVSGSTPFFLELDELWE